MPAKHLGKFLDGFELAAALRAHGIPCHPRTPLEWSRRHAISIKLAGHRLFPEKVLLLLLDGIQVKDIPERLRERDECAAENETPAVTATLRIRSDREVTRARR